jgi:uncharacterized membrane protein YbaN (DUF454 family)
MSRTCKVLEWTGCALGIIGAFLVSMPSQSLRLDGFIAFAASNLFLATWALKQRAWGIFSMQCIYMVSTAMGIYYNL